MGEPEKWAYLQKVVNPATLTRKKAAGLCKHHGCKNFSRVNAGDCETCKSRKWRLKHPRAYAYEQLKRSAAKRNIGFELTLEEFKTFVDSNNYMESKGRDSESLTIDRIDSSRPYRIDNIRVLTYQQNVSRRLEGMTDPRDPIAKALCEAAKDDNWHAWKKRADEVLELVETLQNRPF